MNWDFISECQELSEPFIREFADRVNWGYISRDQILSEPFIREFADKVDWDRLKENDKLTGVDLNPLSYMKDMVSKIDLYNQGRSASEKKIESKRPSAPIKTDIKNFCRNLFLNKTSNRIK